MPARGSAGLKTQLGYLGRGGIGAIDINTEGWMNANRFIFEADNQPNKYYSQQIGLLKADCKPIMLKVHKNKKIGEGSMRTAYKAEVKIVEQDGSI